MYYAIAIIIYNLPVSQPFQEQNRLIREEKSARKRAVKLVVDRA
jgi:hypothetical protein